MKEMLLILLVTASAVAQSQTDKAARDSALRAAVRESRPQPAQTNQASKVVDSIRIVNGVPYPVLSASNWVTLPGPNERARYSRASNYGPVFKLEKRMETRYRQSTGQGTRVWYELIHEIAIKNYPEQQLVIDAPLPPIRAIPIRTTSEGIAVYDYGTVPKAAPSKKQ